MSYTLGQQFEGTYPPDAAIWCNESGQYYIEEVDNINGTPIFEIVAMPTVTEEDKEEQFNSEFFKTSLGYIRRKVTMATGETKDFLSDLLPVISLGVQSGQIVSIITYNKPDFTQELTTEYMKTLQITKTATAQFIQECFLQLSADFTG